MVVLAILTDKGMKKVVVVVEPHGGVEDLAVVLIGKKETEMVLMVLVEEVLMLVLTTVEPMDLMELC